MSKIKDKKTALRLLNKYAESYKSLADENKSLRTEINDLRTTLQINKGIIEEFMKNSNNESRNSSDCYNFSLKQEINRLYTSINTINKEKEELILKYQSSNRTPIIDYENRIFNLENIIMKKDNQIEILNNEIIKLKNLNNNNLKDIITEVYITDPNTMLNKVYDEMITYKESYETMLKSNSKMQKSLLSKEKSIINFQNENMRLREELKFLQDKLNNNLDLNNSENLNIGKTNKKNYIHNPNKSCAYSNPYPLSNRNNYVSKIDFHNEEWKEIMKTYKLEQLDELSKNKFMTPVIEAFEELNKFLIERNQQIKCLQMENESLNSKNVELNNENIRLINLSHEYSNKFNNLKLKYYLILENNKQENSKSINIHNVKIQSYNNINKIYQRNKSVERSLLDLKVKDNKEVDYMQDLNISCYKFEEKSVDSCRNNSINKGENTNNNDNQKNTQIESYCSNICDNYLESEFLSNR